MFWYQFAFLSLMVLGYQGFRLVDASFPPLLLTLNFWVAVAFLGWGGYHALRVIIDCIALGARGEMQAVHMRNGIVLALMVYLPKVLMSWFLIREGFR